MKLDLQNAATEQNPGITGESRAYVLLESARLRCESLMASFGRREHLVAIHREIGMAGYVTCEEFSSEQRNHCLALATGRMADDPLGTRTEPHPGQPQIGQMLAKMFSETISASDALAAELATQDVDETHRDRLHLVHAHVMSACELLDERLTVLELQGAGVDAAS